MLLFQNVSSKLQLVIVVVEETCGKFFLKTTQRQNRAVDS